MQSFDPTKLCAAIHPSHRQLVPQTPISSGSQISDFTQLLNSIAGLVGMACTPMTPVALNDIGLTPDVLSPVRLSPSQLCWYLIHACEDLGVENALQYESPLKRHAMAQTSLHVSLTHL